MTSAILPATSADVDLGNRVLSYLRSLNQSFQGLSVEVADGEVVLSGTLSTPQEKYLAINACQRVAGVLKLNDSIQVAE